VCDAGEQCSGGVCSCGGTGEDCTGSWICCGSSCYNSINDPYHCGDCLTICSTDEECIGGFCMDQEWVRIPGGTFMMGSPEGVGQDDERPRHEVTVTDFEMMRTEVTISQYRCCVDSGVCIEPYSPGDCDWCDRCNWDSPDRDDHPIVCVDWHQAVDFCMWGGGRLPTEAEWEYAARGGGQEINYPWGDQEATCDYTVMSGVTPGVGCGFYHEWPVCSKPAGNTEQGLCDMAGNVWEMVQDRYHDNYAGAPTDGSAWDIPPGYASVMRGGGWDYGAEDLRASNRLGGNPDGRYDSLGFRCARDISP
jgi:formylglycine-generating enzyme required for sulfatase activity